MLKAYEVIKAANNKTTPYGYDRDTEDHRLLVPDEKALNTLEKTLKYVEARALSLRDAAAMVTMTTGRDISYEGIRYILKERQHPIFFGENPYRGIKDIPDQEDGKRSQYSFVGAISRAV
jgi:hypothetical protein